MTHHLGYDLALQQVHDRTADALRPAHLREPGLRRRTARTLRRLADGLDPAG